MHGLPCRVAFGLVLALPLRDPISSRVQNFLIRGIKCGNTRSEFKNNMQSANSCGLCELEVCTCAPSATVSSDRSHQEEGAHNHGVQLDLAIRIATD
jgi:hypothetical protein